jgi:hypothetical protein
VPLKLWLHGLAPFRIDVAGGRVSLQFEKAALEGVLVARGGLTIDQTDKYPIPPEQGTTRPEWHLWAETVESRPTTYIVSVLGISRAGKSIQLGGVTDVSAGEQIGVRFVSSGRTRQVRIDTSGPSVTVD